MKKDNYNAKLKNFSRSMRKDMTSEELHLWLDFLKDLPFTVNRQKIIGNYIVDFFCASGKIVIEIDGESHFTEKGIAYDKERDEYLKSLGLIVLRYSNDSIVNYFDVVCADILKHLPKITT